MAISNKIHIGICERCQSPFMFSCITRGQKYCSRACQYERPPKFSVLHEVCCASCNKKFLSRRRFTKLCSDQCRRDRARSVSLEIDKAKSTLRPHFNCKHCGVVVVPEYGNKSRVFCSKLCARKEARLAEGGSNPRRRARARGAKYEAVSPISVMTRYNFQCAECGINTPLEMRGANQHNSPEIDHIVALAAGGDHVPENLQLLCRECNQVKSDGNYEEKVMSL